MRKNVVPMFHVPDVRVTVDWYRRIGFDVAETFGDAADGLSFAIVAFGDGQVMFSSGGRSGNKHRREVDLYAYTTDVDALFEDLKDRVEIVERPHNMFYGMREIIIRDVNGFWITFGQEIPQEVMTPWPAADVEQLRPFAGKYTSDSGSSVLITVQAGRLLAFPEEGSVVFLKPLGEKMFEPVMNQKASVSFEGNGESMSALVFDLDGRVMRFARALAGPDVRTHNG